MHCHLPAATHNVRSHWMSPADGPASPSCTRAMPQAAAVAYTASTLGAAARCSKSTSFLPLMPLSRLVARHSRMLSRSYGGRVCGAVACVWPVLTRLLSVPCLGHKNRTRGAAQGPSKPRNRQMSQPGSPRAGPSRITNLSSASTFGRSGCASQGALRPTYYAHAFRIRVRSGGRRGLRLTYYAYVLRIRTPKVSERASAPRTTHTHSGFE